MSKILIVSKTRMKDARVCVGGVDLDQHLSVRLLNVNGYHEKETECPYEVGDIRLSLAHWWSKDGETEERCYLQVSGFYLK